MQLSSFIWSLLKWTSVSFRLVSNGCLPIERYYLNKLCRTEPRLEFWLIPTKTCLSHGLALNYLQAMTQEDYFCFMDSDIFATGDFISDTLPFFSNHAGIFAGMPIWVKSEEEVFPGDFRSMTGMFNRTSSDLVLGSTFFAIYDNRYITDVMQSTGIGFEEFRWNDLSTNIQKRLKSLGLAIDNFDTGKVLNLLLLSDNRKLINLTLPSLSHIGGTSFQVFYNSQSPSLKRNLFNKIPGEWSQHALTRYLNLRSRAVTKKRYANSPKAEFNLNTNQRMLRRNPVRQHFLRLLSALHQGTPMPAELITGDEETDSKIKQASQQLINLFQEHRDKLGVKS